MQCRRPPVLQIFRPFAALQRKGRFRFRVKKTALNARVFDTDDKFTAIFNKLLFFVPIDGILY